MLDCHKAWKNLQLDYSHQRLEKSRPPTFSCIGLIFVKSVRIWKIYVIVCDSVVHSSYTSTTLSSTTSSSSLKRFFYTRISNWKFDKVTSKRFLISEIGQISLFLSLRIHQELWQKKIPSSSHLFKGRITWLNLSSVLRWMKFLSICFNVVRIVRLQTLNRCIGMNLYPCGICRWKSVSDGIDEKGRTMERKKKKKKKKKRKTEAVSYPTLPYPLRQQAIQSTRVPDLRPRPRSTVTYDVGYTVVLVLDPLGYINFWYIVCRRVRYPVICTRIRESFTVQT